MPLVNMKDLLQQAEKDGYGVGAFGVADLQMVMGAVAAAEALRSPLILQIAQVRLPYSPLALIGPLMVAAARGATVPVAVHLDHGLDLETAAQALDLGFTSVMIDASALPLDENIALVRKTKALAAPYGAAVEAEIGQLGKSEDGAEGQTLYSDPAEARRMYGETGVDALAVSIGNAHGAYQHEPKLQFGVLETIGKQVGCPLVLHGGTGISDDDFRRCISLGIRKLNIATANFHSSERAAALYHKEHEIGNYFDMSRQMVLAMQENVERHINIFGSNNRM